MELGELIYQPQKGKILSQAVLMAVSLGLSIWTMGNAEIVMHRELRLIVFFVAFLGCVAFGYGLFYNFLRIFKPEPLLKADAEGLWFHGSPMYHGKILWSEIAGYEVAQYGLSKKVLIRLQNPDAFAVKYADYRKWVFKRNLKRYGTCVALPYNLFADDVVKMLNEISAYGRQEIHKS
jgi:hypothetical protein